MGVLEGATGLPVGLHNILPTIHRAGLLTVKIRRQRALNR